MLMLSGLPGTVLCVGSCVWRMSEFGCMECGEYVCRCACMSRDFLVGVFGAGKLCLENGFVTVEWAYCHMCLVQGSCTWRVRV